MTDPYRVDVDLPGAGDILDCPWPSCSWSYTVPTELEALPVVNLRASVHSMEAAAGMFTEMFHQMHLAAAEAQEAVIKQHFDDAHPGWTMAEAEAWEKANLGVAA